MREDEDEWRYRQENGPRFVNKDPCAPSPTASSQNVSRLQSPQGRSSLKLEALRLKVVRERVWYREKADEFALCGAHHGGSWA